MCFTVFSAFPSEKSTYCSALELASLKIDLLRTFCLLGFATVWVSDARLCTKQYLTLQWSGMPSWLMQSEVASVVKNCQTNKP